MTPTYTAAPPPEMPLSRTAVSGVLLRAISWTCGATSVSYGMIIARSVILARMLSPADYGIVGLALALSSGLNLFTDFSLGAKIIVKSFRSQTEQSEYLNTVFTAELLRRLLLSVLLVASAPLCAHYFGDGRVAVAVVVVGFTPLILGFENIGLTLLRKDLALKRIAIQAQGSEVVGVTITVGVALFVKNYYALLCGQVCEAIVRVAMSYYICRSWPRLRFNRGVLTDCFGFGRHLFVIGLLTFVTTQSDNLIVGHCIGTAALGGYLLAYRLACAPVDFLSKVINATMFPAYARIRSSRPNILPALFAKVNVISSSLLVAVLGILALCPGEIVQALYGSKWTLAGRLLGVLVFVGLFRGLAQGISPLLLAMGRPDLDAKCKIVEALLFVPLTYWSVVRFGALGAAWTGALCYALAYGLRLCMAVRVVEGDCGALVIRILKPLAVAAGSFGAAQLARHGGATAVTVSLIYTATLMGGLYAADAEVRQQMWGTVRKVRRYVGQMRGLANA